MEYVTTAASGLAIGFSAVSVFFTLKARSSARKIMAAYRLLLDCQERTEAVLDSTETALNALRRNCFITNEKGHRVRYFNASPEKRAAAEQ